jgi:hypothetical protein
MLNERRKNGPDGDKYGFGAGAGVDDRVDGRKYDRVYGPSRALKKTQPEASPASPRLTQSDGGIAQRCSEQYSKETSIGLRMSRAQCGVDKKFCSTAPGRRGCGLGIVDL